MYNLYNTNLDEVKKEAWVKGSKAGKSTVDEWQALERIKAKVFEEGYEKGYADAQAGYRKGRQAGFRAGFEAATGQPQAKIEAAYEQGMKKVLDSR